MRIRTVFNQNLCPAKLHTRHYVIEIDKCLRTPVCEPYILHVILSFITRFLSNIVMMNLLDMYLISSPVTTKRIIRVYSLLDIEYLLENLEAFSHE